MTGVGPYVRVYSLSKPESGWIYLNPLYEVNAHQKTVLPRVADVDRQWHLIDAEGQILGRLSTRVADLLHGKGKPDYTPFLDGGDHVVVINAGKVRLTGRKWQQKRYYRYSGYPGGLRERTAAKVREERPEELILHAVRGMLPKNRLGRQMLTRLRVFPGPDHDHAAQRPQSLPS